MLRLFMILRAFPWRSSPPRRPPRNRRRSSSSAGGRSPPRCRPSRSAFIAAAAWPAACSFRRTGPPGRRCGSRAIASGVCRRSSTYIEKLSQDAAKLDGWPGLLIGDMSQPRGGPMVSGHASHQIGLDVDIWLDADARPAAEREGAGGDLRDRRRRSPARTRSIPNRWTAGAWAVDPPRGARSARGAHLRRARASRRSSAGRRGATATG